MKFMGLDQILHLNHDTMLTKELNIYINSYHSFLKLVLVNAL